MNIFQRMKIWFAGTLEEFRGALGALVGCRQQPKDRLFFRLEVEGADEPIPKGNMARIKLSSPIAPGFRRRVNLTPDHPVDVREDGTYAAIDPVEGDSTIDLRKDEQGNHLSTADKIRVWVNGNGALGSGKVGRVRADGKIGPQEAEISVELEWDVAHPDATTFGNAVEEEGPDEPIPAQG